MFVIRFLVLAALLAVGNTALFAADAADAEQAPVEFDSQIRSILQAKCFRCHGEKQRKGELDLRSRESILTGGNAGAALKPNSPAESPLIEMIESEEMPPAGEEPRVTADELALLKRWIAGGAPGSKTRKGESLISDEDRKFWSFVKPVKAPVPQVQAQDRVRTPIDAYILQRLEEKGLTMNPDADRRTLIRRLYFDLLGLPPTPAEIQRFLSDTAPDAYERLVDELLASQHFGERWARHWLDAVGYADSNGRRGDETRSWAWRYRDYVIRSFNTDKPYNVFLTQQLAGDELLNWRAAETLSPEMVENLVATGFLRTSRDATDTEMVDERDDRYMLLHDTVEVTVNSLLGLTLGCAKCHSHKYDPIPQADFYKFEAFFTPAYNPDTWLPGNHRDITPEEQLRYLKEATPAQLRADAAINGPIDNAIAELKKPLEKVQAKFRQTYRTEALVKLPAPVQAAFAKGATERSADEQKLFTQHEKQLTATDAQLAAIPAYVAEAKPFNDAVAAAQSARPAKRPLLWALWDLDSKPPATHLHIRGDFLTPGPRVKPGVFSVLEDPEHPFTAQEPGPDAVTTGYRTQLAKWVTSEQNPLTPRVIVNRIWQHHFGRGIVGTPHDLGATGERPSHPELLDWLAVELIDQGWSLKKLHRAILLSSVYRQSADFDDVRAQQDPEDRLLWRKTPLRLEAEVIRDTVLAISGKLNPEMHGPAIPVVKAADGQFVAEVKGEAANRRSIYLLNKRTESVTFLTTFDAPQMELSCSERFRSTVPQQALAMMNSQFMADQAEAFAALIETTAPADVPGTIGWTFERVLGRLPTESELKLLTDFLNAEITNSGSPPVRNAALFQFAHTLLNTNELLYID